MPRVSRVTLVVMTAAMFLVASATPVAAATVTIRITDRLEPDRVSVVSGTTVRWVNDSDDRHRMRSQSGPGEFDSGNIEPGESYSVKLSRTGTYRYLDERDDEDSSYFGTIVVTEPGSDSDPTPKPTATSGGAAPAPGGGGVTAPTTGSVGMAGKAFRPATVTIAAGGSVTWRNDDDREHTVTAKAGAFDSGVLGEGETWKRTFPNAGTFAYLCAIHPEMTGKVVVEASGSTGGSPAKPAPTPKPTRKPTPKPTDVAPVPGAASISAEVRDFAFSPAELSVPVGSSVTWNNVGDAPHTVTAEDGSFDSEMIAPGGSWARTFDAEGSFAFVCAFHPEMTGVVTVTATLGATGRGPEPSTASPSARPPASAGSSPTAAAVAAGTGPTAPPAVDPSAPVAARAALPEGELLARVGIVGLLIGGAVLLFMRAVGGSAHRREISAR